MMRSMTDWSVNQDYLWKSQRKIIVLLNIGLLCSLSTEKQSLVVITFKQWTQEETQVKNVKDHQAGQKVDHSYDESTNQKEVTQDL